MNFNKAAVETHFLLHARDSSEARTVMTASRGKTLVTRHALLTQQQPCRKNLLPEKLIFCCLVTLACFFPVLQLCSGADGICLPFLETYYYEMHVDLETYPALSYLSEIFQQYLSEVIGVN